jgi:hypothetical protein
MDTGCEVQEDRLGDEGNESDNENEEEAAERMRVRFKAARLLSREAIRAMSRLTGGLAHMRDYMRIVMNVDDHSYCGVTRCAGTQITR